MKGFTLIELLIYIALLGIILAGIMGSAFSISFLDGRTRQAVYSHMNE